MEETRWLTKTKIIIMSSLVLIVGLIVIFVAVKRHNLRRQYKEYETQLEYAAPNYLLKEKIQLKPDEYRKINVDELLRQKLITNKKSSDCEGYVIAKASDLVDKENKYSDDISYKAYIKCKKIYTTQGYGSNSADGVENKTKIIEKKDKTKPLIELVGSDEVHLKVGDEYKENGATAIDNVDGDLTKNIKISGTVDTSKAGTYKIKYSVFDLSSNKATITRVVIVEEKEQEKELTDDDFDYGTNDDDVDDFDYDTDDDEDDDYYYDNTPSYTPSNNTPSSGGNKSTPVVPKPSTKISVSGVNISPNNKTLSVGQSITLSVSIVPSNATDKTITFSTSNPSVASVDSNGVVKAISKGTTTIKATSSNGKAGNCKITVN